MSKKQNTGADEKQSVAKVSRGKRGTGKGGRNPSVDHSRREKDARAGVAKAGRSARGLGPPCEKCGQIHKRCSAHNNRGGPCGQQPLRFQQVCRSHGGATKLSRKAAQERMMELVWPALARLDQLVNDPDTDPAIVVKVVAQILDRAHGAGLNKHASMDVGFGEETPFSRLISADSSAFTILRGEENVVDESPSPQLSDAQREALASGGGDEATDAALEELLDQRRRAREREASTKLDNRDHEVIQGDVERPALDPFNQDAKDRAASMRPGEYVGGPGPDDGPWDAYERKVREAVEDWD